MSLRTHVLAMLLGVALAGTALAQPVIHVTDRLDRRPEAVAARRAYQAARDAGLLPANKAAVTYSIGDTVSFKVVDKILTSESPWLSLRFVLRRQSDVANIWVQVDELRNGHVTEARLAELNQALLFQTPSGSYNSGKGIIANDNDIFGLAPDVDGDGVVDVLLYDIVEGVETNGAFIAGYVTSGNLYTNAGGNFRDILYLDTYPALIHRNQDLPLETAAHEYQHLINYTYSSLDDTPASEATFVNEGQSEWAERMNGYPGRDISYLATPAERNQALFTWREDPDEVLLDYERAGLFTTFLAERIGPVNVGKITQSTSEGVSGYRNTLSSAVPGASLDSLIADFHATNALNDDRVAGFAYTSPTLQSLPFDNPDVYYDGDAGNSAPLDTLAVQHGGAAYVVFDNVRDLRVSVDVLNSLGSTLPLQRSRAGIRAILYPADGSVPRVQSLHPAPSEQVLPGAWQRVILSLAHGKPITNASTIDQVRYRYSATWNPLATAAEPQELPARIALEQNYPNPFNPATTIRYALPQAAEVRLAVYDVLGREMAVLVQGVQDVGTHDVALDATGWPSGVYFYALRSGGQTLSQRMVLLK